MRVENPVILVQIVVEPLRHLRKAVAVLVTPAALKWSVWPILDQCRLRAKAAAARDARRWRDDDEAGLAQTAGIQGRRVALAGR